MAITNGYCTLVELKAQANITDTADDTKLEMAIEAVSRNIDTYCERRFYAATETRLFVAEDDGELMFVNDLISVDELRTDDDGDGVFETLWNAAWYRLEPLNAAVDGKPYTRVAISRRATRRFPVYAEVQIVGSYGVPSTSPWMKIVKQACLIQSHRVFKRKDSPFGVAGANDFGQLIMLRAKLDPDVEAMLSELLNDKAVLGV